MDSKNILQLYNANNISYIGIGRKETKKVIHMQNIIMENRKELRT